MRQLIANRVHCFERLIKKNMWQHQTAREPRRAKAFDLKAFLSQPNVSAYPTHLALSVHDWLGSILFLWQFEKKKQERERERDGVKGLSLSFSWRHGDLFQIATRASKATWLSVSHALEITANKPHICRRNWRKVSSMIKSFISNAERHLPFPMHAALLVVTQPW